MNRYGQKRMERTKMERNKRKPKENKTLIDGNEQKLTGNELKRTKKEGNWQKRTETDGTPEFQYSATNGATPSRCVYHMYFPYITTVQCQVVQYCVVCSTVQYCAVCSTVQYCAVGSTVQYCAVGSTVTELILSMLLWLVLRGRTLHYCWWFSQIMKIVS